MSRIKDAHPDNSIEDFAGTFGVVSVGHNNPTDSLAEDGLKIYRERNFIYLNVAKSADREIGTALSRDTALALRDHLNTLLGEQPVELEAVAEPVVSDDAVEAMKNLAFELDMFDTDAIRELADAINGLRGK